MSIIESILLVSYLLNVKKIQVQTWRQTDVSYNKAQTYKLLGKKNALNSIKAILQMDFVLFPATNL